MYRFLMNLRSYRALNNYSSIQVLNLTRLASNATATNPDEPVNMRNPFEKKPQQCLLCKHNIVINHKNVKLLSQFQSPYTGQIYGRHITGLCKRRQEEVEKAIIRAQNCALMPTYHKDVDFLKDPKLLDAEKPIRQHKY